jgi:cyclopropane fatty-acyl-phospholipid synthase-like methyltransferase
LPQPWYTQFFHGVALDFWRAVVTPAQTAAEVDFLESELDLRPGARVLDVPCGNGRHALELARRGCRTAGLDLAAEFIAEASAASQQESLDAEWRLADMRDVGEDRRVRRRLCLGNSFGYLDHDGNADFLRAVSAALKPGGSFALHTGMAAESLFPAAQTDASYEFGGIQMQSHKIYNAAAGQLQIDYTFTRSGVLETRSITQHVYTAAEISRLLGRAGLASSSLYASLDRQPFQLGSPQLFLIATKAP